jgi:hypothetical protein
MNGTDGHAAAALLCGCTMRTPEEIQAESARLSAIIGRLHLWCRAGSISFTLGLLTYVGWMISEMVYYGSPQLTSALVAALVLGLWGVLWWGPIRLCDLLIRRLKHLATEYQRACESKASRRRSS